MTDYFIRDVTIIFIDTDGEAVIMLAFHMLRILPSPEQAAGVRLPFSVYFYEMVFVSVYLSI